MQVFYRGAGFGQFWTVLHCFPRQKQGTGSGMTPTPDFFHLRGGSLKVPHFHHITQLGTLISIYWIYSCSIIRPQGVGMPVHGWHLTMQFSPGCSEESSSKISIESRISKPIESSFFVSVRGIHSLSSQYAQYALEL